MATLRGKKKILDNLLKSLKLGWKMELDIGLKTDYSFTVVFETISMAPVQAILRLYAIKGDEHKLISSPSDLKGTVRIENEEDALKFVRFITSPDTHIFFDLYAIEGFKEGENPFEPFGTIPNTIWEKYRLKPVKVERDKGLFVIDRYLVFYPHQELLFPKRLVAVKEYIEPDGGYSLELKEEIASDEEIKDIRMPIE